MFDPCQFKDLDPGSRVLMGPGPSDVASRVLRAMSAPCIGHLDPYMLKTMDEIQELLRYTFQTENELTLAVSGTGSSGMETCLTNLIEPGDTVLVCVNGFFATRLGEITQRLGGRVVEVKGPWGRAIDVEAVRQAAQEAKPKILAAVQAETSTGVWNPIPELAAVAKDVGALTLVDMVTSLGGMPAEVEKLGVDAVYSCSQKCIGCPPGLAPVTFSPAAVDKIKGRTSPILCWYMDLNLLGAYWGSERKYHHTASSNMMYALREALRLVAEEGLDARFARHRLAHQALVAGVEAMGLEMLVPEAERLPMLNTIKIPDGVDDAKARKALLADFGLEIGGGLGDLAGQVWRVGIMGSGATRRNVILFLSALKSVLTAQGVKVGSGIDAAGEVWAGS